MSDYKPGTVAEVTYLGRRCRAMRTGTPSNMGWEIVRGDGSKTWASDRSDALCSATDIRPLVVLDLDDYCGERAVNYLRNLARESRDVMGNSPSPRGKLANLIADQIEAQTKLPKPAEPSGLGAVVEASNGMRWVAARPDSEPVRWRSWPAGMWHPYEDIDAVRVLSEGVEA